MSSSLRSPSVAKPETKSSGRVCSMKFVAVFDRIMFESVSSLFLDNDRFKREFIVRIDENPGRDPFVFVIVGLKAKRQLLIG